jgi:DNA-binding NtrC family response regulator
MKQKHTLQTLAALALDCGQSLAELEKLWTDAIVHQALIRTHGNRIEAAAMLGVHRNTLTRLLPASEPRKARRAIRKPQNLDSHLQRWENGVKIPVAHG